MSINWSWNGIFYPNCRIKPSFETARLIDFEAFSYDFWVHILNILLINLLILIFNWFEVFSYNSWIHVFKQKLSGSRPELMISLLGLASRGIKLKQIQGSYRT